MKNGIAKTFIVQDPSIRGRRQCEDLAADWIMMQIAPSSTTIRYAVNQYIEYKQKALSPATIRAYRVLQKHAYGSIEDIPIADLSTKLLQRWMDDYMLTHAPKTCRNALGLLYASIADYTDARFRVKLPEYVDELRYEPTDEDIRRLLKYIQGTELEKAVLLAAFGTLRRGEVCALTYDDIQDNTITVNKTIVYDGAEDIVKRPKTVSSVRTVELPPTVIKTLLRSPTASGKVVDLSIGQLSNQFRRAIRHVNCPPFRFHDLRAYSASIRHALGIPDQYIMRDGGWKTDSVLKKVYRRAMEDKRKEFSAVANAHFEDLLNS